MFITVFAGNGAVLKEISTCSFAFIELAFETPFNFVVKMEVVAVVPCVSIIGVVLGVENTIFIFVKSIGNVPGARPIVNLISSIPAEGLEANP